MLEFHEHDLHEDDEGEIGYMLFQPKQRKKNKDVARTKPDSPRSSDPDPDPGPDPDRNRVGNEDGSSVAPTGWDEKSGSGPGSGSGSGKNVAHNHPLFGPGPDPYADYRPKGNEKDIARSHPNSTRISDPDPGPGPDPDWNRRGEELGNNVAPTGSGPGPGSGSEQNPRRRGRCTKRQFMERMALIHQCRVQNYSTEAIHRLFKQEFGLGLRSVQRYLQLLTEKYADDASTQDYLAHQQLARLQQEHLFELARRDLDKCKTPRERLGYLRFMGATLKQRDQIVASIQEHRRFCKRDQSPDGEQARLKRGRMVKMPIEEVFERDENMKRNWNHEWVRCLDEYIEKNGLADKVPAELKETIVELPYLFKGWMKEREDAWQAQAALIGPGPD